MLDKYLAAAKGIAAHAVLLPDGFPILREDDPARLDRGDPQPRSRASIADTPIPGGARRSSSRGWSGTPRGAGSFRWRTTWPRPSPTATAVLPGKNLAAIAAENHLSAKYLQTLWDMLDGPRIIRPCSIVFARLASSPARRCPALAAEIRRWQGALTRFRSVGHFKPWQETSNPLAGIAVVPRQAGPAPGAQEVVIRSSHGDAGDGSSGDHVEWKEPRLESPGRPPRPAPRPAWRLDGLEAKRQTLKDAARYLAAADAVRTGQVKGDPAALAEDHRLDPEMLAAWLDTLGIAGSGRPAVGSTRSSRIAWNAAADTSSSKSWGSPQTPSIVANSSDREVRIPGIMKPHSVAMHPSPTRNVVVGWRSPMTGLVRVEARAVHAHPECGNGLTWALELRRDAERRRLRAGEIDRGQAAKIEPVEKLIGAGGRPRLPADRSPRRPLLATSPRWT